MNNTHPEPEQKRQPIELEKRTKQPSHSCSGCMGCMNTPEIPVKRES